MGIEPVPADRQSTILPIDHSSGSLPWIRTTISAFRAQRPTIGRRGNFEIVKELVAGERFERPYPDSKSRVLPLDDPASHSQRYRPRAADAQHRRFINIVAQGSAISPSPVHQLAVISASVAMDLCCDLDFKTVNFHHFSTHNLVAARRIELPSQP